MATITSTIKLVDQMSPTLNKISKAIDRVNEQTNKLNRVKMSNGFNRSLDSMMKSANIANTAVGKLYKTLSSVSTKLKNLSVPGMGKNLTTHINKTTRGANGLYNSLRRVVFILGTLRGLKGFAQISDTMMNATARLNNINDGLYTTAQYLDIIYASAQRSRGSFSNMISTVSKLGTIAGDAFGSVNEMIAFVELMNKLFTLSGASAAEASNAMYQLTQAMAAGKLQGDEMRSIMENAPLLAKKIADSLGVTKGELKKLGAEGKITADVIKNALFEAADEIEEKFSKMPKTLGQVWTEIKNAAVKAFQPVIQRIQQFINSPIFEKFKNNVIGILNAIANAVIRLFDAFETPRVQNALSKIGTALGVLWDIFSSVATAIANGIIWIADNWNWLGQIVYAVIAIILIYKAVMLAVSAAVCIAEIAKGIAAWVGALMAGQAWAWVILIIVALVAIIYIGVAAWNHFTGAAVSATGVLFGCVAFVVACVWDLIAAVLNLIVGIVVASVQVGMGIWNTFVWLGEVVAIWASNIMNGMSQLCDALPLYWQMFGYKVQETFWSIVVAAGNAFNSLLQGAANVANRMVTPFVKFGNAVIKVFNSIIRGWNSFASKLTITIPGVSIMGKQLWGEKTVKLLGNSVSELSYISEGAGISAPQLDMSGAQMKADLAALGKNYIASQIGNINWNSTPLPSYGDAVNWGDIGSTIANAFGTFGYSNPVDAFKNWYDKGSKLEDGVNGLVDGIGALIGALFGDGGSTPNGPLGELNRGQGTGSLPSSLEDLLGSGSDIGDKLGAIGDNTGKGAGSAGSIDDKLDLAEEELELLRKLAEQEVINRFTTAEIHVDMTNNNNISSDMDLDGIVTHLSTKLYEELGVVASGVHY